MSKILEGQETAPAGGTEAPDGEDLAVRFRSGEGQAFDGLVRVFQSRIYNLAYRILNSAEEADDATQDIFVKVHGSIDKFRGHSKFSTWLYAIAVNMCRNRLRRTKRRSLFEVHPADGRDDGESMPGDMPDSSAADPHTMMDRSELMAAVQEAIGGLPAEFAEAVVMKDVQGMSYDEIAEAVGCSLGTVKSRISRGRLAVKDKIRPYLDGMMK